MPLLIKSTCFNLRINIVCDNRPSMGGEKREGNILMKIIRLILSKIGKFLLISISTMVCLLFILAISPRHNPVQYSNHDALIFISGAKARILPKGLLVNKSIDIKLKDKFIISEGDFSFSELKTRFPRKDLYLSISYTGETVIKSELVNGKLIFRDNPFFRGTHEYYKISTDKLGDFHYQVIPDPLLMGALLLFLMLILLHLVNICFIKNKKISKVCKILEVVLFTIIFFKISII